MRREEIQEGSECQRIIELEHRMRDVKGKSGVYIERGRILR